MTSSRSSKVHNPHQCNYIIYRKVKNEAKSQNRHYEGASGSHAVAHPEHFIACGVKPANRTEYQLLQVNESAPGGVLSA